MRKGKFAGVHLQKPQSAPASRLCRCRKASSRVYIFRNHILHPRLDSLDVERQVRGCTSSKTAICTRVLILAPYPHKKAASQKGMLPGCCSLDSNESNHFRQPVSSTGVGRHFEKKVSISWIPTALQSATECSSPTIAWYRR